MMRTLPNLEARVPWAEVEFLLVAWAVGNVAFAINARDLSVGHHHCKAVIMMRTLCLEEAGRDPDLQFFCQFLHREDRRMFVRGSCVGEQALVLDPAEIGAFEQLGRK